MVNEMKGIEYFTKFLLKRWVAFAHDLVWVPIALVLAFWIRANLGAIPPLHWEVVYGFLLIAIPVQAVAFYFFGLYRGIWRFASIPDLIRILQAVWIGAAVSFLLLFFADRLVGMPRSVILLYPLFLTLGLTAPRLLYRWVKDHRLGLKASAGRRTLVIGAGRAGDMLVRDLVKNESYVPAGILDDDPGKQGRALHGIRILGGLSDLERFVEKLRIEVVLVAIPTAGPRVMRRIVEACAHLKVECVTLPSMMELADGQVSVSRLRRVRLEDLLGRAVVRLDDARVCELLAGKRVLVTGAGGSIGSELVRQVAGYAPAHVVLLDQGEFNLYSIEREMAERDAVPPYTAVLADVRDDARMREIFEVHRPDIVLHAAAYKHVPLVEDNPDEGIRTNVFGTRVVADLAGEYGVERFVLVSTDKAVNPTNVMGATKRVAELYCQGLNAVSETAFITTRFGNVLGSAGSVVPLFREQIERGGPVTVTHPEITRFFMTIPEAVSLILQATAMGEGGEIFVLDMGEPVRIVDLAREMIRLSGLEPEKDVEIRFVGLRPGEKLHEELFHGQESLVGTTHPKILRAAARNVALGDLVRELTELESKLGSEGQAGVVKVLREIVPEFTVAPVEVGKVPAQETAKALH
ncbi:polysaccharide biosynthesis protein [Thioalkalivibrio denitrificans]|uniref:Polysaccharide biosynthesis protein n=2 Tax=Thioalkalivibrio denitrificans TaxID=108003 RepID=A0A1V3NCK6_9GAMM|nr:polysaccharide biosynthesis protein [Thioalkalivibrio denitrificans]